MSSGHTVTTRASTDHVTISVDGTVIADSRRPVVLDETGLPTRYYLPRDDVRRDLLTPTDTTTVCAYKGHAAYWSATVGAATIADVAWSFEQPHNYATAVGDLICFFNERVDITVDGTPMPRPQTPWS